MKIITSDFIASGHQLYLLGESKEELGANEITYMLTESGRADGIGGEVPRLDDIEANLAMYSSLSEAIHSGMVSSAHDCSEGGVSVALVEMCIGGRLGASVDIENIGDASIWARLFGESLARIIVAVSPENIDEFEEKMEPHYHTRIGTTTEINRLAISSGNDELIDVDIDIAIKAWKSTFCGGDI